MRNQKKLCLVISLKIWTDSDPKRSVVEESRVVSEVNRPPDAESPIYLGSGIPLLRRRQPVLMIGMRVVVFWGKVKRLSE